MSLLLKKKSPEDQINPFMKKHQCMQLYRERLINNAKTNISPVLQSSSYLAHTENRMKTKMK